MGDARVLGDAGDMADVAHVRDSRLLSNDRAARGVQLLGVDLKVRWFHASTDLQLLAHGLHAELGALCHGAPLPIPVQKARLTRRGGRCEVDGTPLTFAPWLSHRHVCPTCQRVYEGAEHDDWWALGAQLWCAERTLHAAILGSMWHDDSLLALAQQSLNTFSDRWDTYPNRDNVLGPSRLFFSTYLESVWLLNTTLAAHVLRSYSESAPANQLAAANEAPLVSHASARAAVDRFTSRVVEPSRALIASYPEGLSNRQTWHTAALLAVASLLRDDSAVAPLLDGAHGVSTLIGRGLLSDGTWYEGENYHLFAHRGLWYGVTLLNALGVALPDRISARFAAGFRTPLLGVLPDGTFPSRRDSRYAVSVHQWRFAEWCELGLQHSDDTLLRTWLHRLYAAPHARGDTGRSRSTADIERDEPAQRLARSDLGWRTLLFARNQPWPAQVRADQGSVMLPAQGLHVLRRDADRIYVAVEGGHIGGGHGHPDRLALTIQDRTTRVLEDPGTGSYVERTLHWYRSTLAHNAPLINGRSQRPVAAQLLAFEAHSGVAWTRVRAEELAPGVSVQRTAVLLDEHVVDHVQWDSAREITIDLPVHMEGETADARVWSPGQPFAAGGLEDGVGFVRDAEWTPVAAGEFMELVRTAAPHAPHARNAPNTSNAPSAPAQDTALADQPNTPIRCWYALSNGGELWRAIAPGPPGHGERQMYWLRARGETGEMLGVWSLRGSVESVGCPTYAGLLLPVNVLLRNGTTAVHSAAAYGWHVGLHVGTASSNIELLTGRAANEQLGREPGPVGVAEQEVVERPTQPAFSLVLEPHRRIHFLLAQPHYRRSEQSWLEAGSLTADVDMTATEQALHIRVSAHTGVVVVPETHAVNHLDNERADVNADGLQLYIAPLESTEWTGAWLLVPHADGARVTVLAGTRQHPGVPAGFTVHSEHTATGWLMDITLPLEPHGVQPWQRFRFDLIVNERPAERERRRGQLVLSGSRGEFVYLRGDRHDLLRSWVLHCVPTHVSRSLSEPQV